MKRIILLAMVAFMAMLVLAPMAMAQDTTMMMEDTGMMMEETGMMMEDTGMMEMTGVRARPRFGRGRACTSPVFFVASHFASISARQLFVGRHHPKHLCAPPSTDSTRP
jgi:hypothetical protein